MVQAAGPGKPLAHVPCGSFTGFCRPMFDSNVLELVHAREFGKKRHTPLRDRRRLRRF
ncbi:hypothetical protein QW131_30685 [Roseibium salinum]|nr:hypothetical protein [Roseibium salinum]